MGSFQPGTKTGRGSASSDYDAAESAQGVCVRQEPTQKRVQPKNRMRKTARPGLCGGQQVTGVPTARKKNPEQNTQADMQEWLTFGI